MDMSPEMITLGTELATIAGRKSVEAIFDKMKAIKKKGDKDEIISNLEEIINELIADKNSLIQISQAYEEKLITQKMTENEIEYITTSVVPLVEDLLKQNTNEDTEKMQEGIDVIKALLSKETFNIMQILGFNFKQAIGEPLTELIAGMIRTKVVDVDKTMELQLLIQKREMELLKVCQNDIAYERLLELNRNDL